MTYSATYSVYNLHVENELKFNPTGLTAGYILAIDENGKTYWKENN
jgi:hypothetical protein